MNSKSFRYRNNKLAMIYIIILGIILVWSVPTLLSSLTGNSYYIMNIIVSVAIVYFLWYYTDYFPGVNCKGHYRIENDIMIISYEKKQVRLDRVTEIFLSDKRAFSKGATLSITNNGNRIDFLSIALKDKEKVEDTDLYMIITQLLAENKALVQEKDLQGNPIEYWYKAQ